MSTVNVVYATNDGYVFLAGVSIVSLFENNTDINDLDVFILSDGISGKSRELLGAIGQKYNRSIIFVDVRESLDKLSEGTSLNYDNAIDSGNTCNAKLLIGSLLTDVNRALYLDCDTIIQGSIINLYETELGSASIGMAYDCINDRYKVFNGLGIKEKYYNSGVILFDLKNWRTSGCLDKIIYHIRNVRIDYPLPDQDLINIVLHEHIKCIEMKYNYLSQYFLYEYNGNCSVYHHSREAYWKPNEWMSREEADDNAVIFHFCGNTFIRPWFANSQHPMKKKYDKYYYKSPWKNRLQENYHLPIGYRIQLLLYKSFPYKLQILAGMVMQRIFIWKTYGV